MNIPADTDWRHLLTEAQRARMLDDIARVSLAVGRRLFAEQPWDDLDISARSLAEHKTPVERLGFIARMLPDLARTLHQISGGPQTRLQWEAHPVSPPARARRVDTAAILSAVRRGHAERRVEERAASWTPDTPENRAVQAFLAALRRDAGTIAAIAEAAGEHEFQQSAEDAATRLRVLEVLPLWDQVMADAGAWRVLPTHRMLADPPYAHLAGMMRRYRQSFQFDWTHPLFSLPARETWRLYEVWGLFQVLEALLALGCAPTVATGVADSRLFAIHQERLTFSVVKGVQSRVSLSFPDGQPLSLFYNRAYPQRTHSLSRTMLPDIVVERAEGATWVLDPKFKAYSTPGSEDDDMDQMHAYRDAIIGQDGERTVARAWCLFCGGPETDSRPLIAYAPPHIVGALRLRPGDAKDFQRLCQLLDGWLNEPRR